MCSSDLSPSNFALTNPQVVKATVESKGENLIKGLQNLLTDLERGKGKLAIRQTDMKAFQVGGNVATSGSLTAASLTAASTATILGAATFNSNVTVTSNLNVTQTTTTSNVTTSTLTVNTGGGGYLQLGTLTGPRLTAGTVAGQAAASWNAPLFAPYISSGTVEAAGSATFSTLVVTGSISAPTVATVAGKRTAAAADPDELAAAAVAAAALDSRSTSRTE